MPAAAAEVAVEVQSAKRGWAAGLLILDPDGGTVLEEHLLRNEGTAVADECLDGLTRHAMHDWRPPVTSYDRVRTTVSHEQPDRPPMELMATAGVIDGLRRQLQADSEEEVLCALQLDFRPVSAQVTKQQPVPSRIAQASAARADISATPYGVVLRQEPNFPQAHRIWGPFYDTDELDSFDWPLAEDVELSDESVRKIARWNDAGYCTVARCNNPFKFGYFMRRFGDFLVDCIQRPDFVLELLRRIADVEFSAAETCVRAGCRAAMIFGDFADQRSLMLGPQAFRRVLKPVLAEYVARMHAVRPDVLVFLHSDGNLFEVLGDLIDCGFDAVHPIQPESMNMWEVKRVFGDRLTLFGGVSVQSELPHLGPEAVRALVRQRVDELGRGGGFMLAPSNTILPDCAPESVLAMYSEGSRSRAPSRPCGDC